MSDQNQEQNREQQGGDSVAGNAEKMMHNCAHDTQRIKEDVEDMAHKAGSEARRIAEKTGHNIEGFGKDVAKHIHDKPIQSLATALGIGLIFGMLYRR